MTNNKIKMLSKTEILSELCYYDLRNPEGIINEDDYGLKELQKIELEKKSNKCSCNNCFYGRTIMAENLLYYYNIIFIK